jgi:hypothetical protein
VQLFKKNIESNCILKWIVCMEKVYKSWKNKTNKGSKRKDIKKDKEKNIVESSFKKKKKKHLTVEND